MGKKSVAMMVLAVFSLVAAWGLQAADLYVTTTEDQVPGSLRAAITIANSNGENDTIHLPTGTYILAGAAREDANTSGDLDIDTGHGIAIKGKSVETTIIDGNQVDRILHILKGTVSIEGVTFQKGKPGDGRGEYEKGEDGGGILNRGTLTLTGCQLRNNRGGNGWDPPMSSFIGGAGGSGGAIYNDGTLTLNGVSLNDNAAGKCGPQYSGYSILDGRPGRGGAIFNSNSGTMVLKNCRIVNNMSGYAENNFDDNGLFINGGDGGGICNEGTQELFHCTLDFNHSGIGGMGDEKFSEEGRSGRGGAIYNSGNSLLKKCVIMNNYTGISWEDPDDLTYINGDPTGGGGIYNSGTFSLSDCDISHNTAYTGGIGGGIHHHSGTLTLTRCSIINNKSGNGILSCCYSQQGGNGGGIFNESTMTITNCTISGNQSGTGANSDYSEEIGGNGGDGAGIYNRGNLTLINTTLCQNITSLGGNAGGGNGRPGYGGGIYNLAGSILNIKNTILANNSTAAGGEGPDAWGTIDSQGYNLVENTTDCIITGILTGNITGVDPLLGSLADNGGPTQTHALLPGSPAIDAGNSTGISQDQRGFTRPVDIPGIANVSDGSDIGAYELQSLNDITISGTITNNGTGVEDVALTFSNNGGTVTSDAQGNYVHRVDYGWSGTVTPSKTGFSFTPSSRSYTNVATAKSHQNYTALPSGGVVYTLTVQSAPDTGISITVSPADKNNNGNGATNFTRTYNSGTNVTLTAPDSFNGKEFSKWMVDGVQSTGSTVQVTMNSNHTAAAHYVAAEPSVISLNRTNFHFGVKLPGGEDMQTGAQTLLISNHGGGTLQWSAEPSALWLLVSPTSGTGNGEVLVSVNAAGLSQGAYTGTITVSDSAASNSPQTANVTLKVYQDTTPPFGSFDTPVDGAVVQGSIAVTGWALDDIGIDSVKIYRDENNSPVYIGDAVLVEGSRPDIEATYPDYPNNDKAGWGYMLLTNFLPNQGSGTFTIYAQAADIEGHTVILGTKTITCDNANAERPFGAIDTPAQGGTASGNYYLNYGWVLTPPPNTIPTDGSTIQVWVDGVSLGHPAYNQNREDVAGLFPRYNNSNGAGGYFALDTTGYENGVHTIFWTAIDDAGNSDGIGSRYFTIQNLTGSNEQGEVKTTNYKIQITNKPQTPNYKSQKEEVPSGDAARRLERNSNACGEAPFTTGHWQPATGHQPLFLQRGYKPESELETLFPDENGQYSIEIKELERLVLYLEDIETGSNSCRGGSRTAPTSKDILPFQGNQYEGYLVNGDEIKPLPIGSTLDRSRGVFYWQPGPGFLGIFRLLFIKTDQEGNITGKDVQVNIIPKF